MKNLSVQNFGIGEVTMNELINDLFDKALDEVVPNTWTNLTMNQLNDIKNKFAELIIEACLHQCYCRGMNDEPYEGQLVAAEYIKEYFGVT